MGKIRKVMGVSVPSDKIKDEDIRDGIYNYNMRYEASNLCHSVTYNIYGEAPKKKISRGIFYENVHLSYHMGCCNSLIAVLRLITEKMEEGWTPEEVQGALQIALKANWDLIAKNKIGMHTFRKMELESIINAKDSTEYLKTGVYSKDFIKKEK